MIKNSPPYLCPPFPCAYHPPVTSHTHTTFAFWARRALGAVSVLGLLVVLGASVSVVRAQLPGLFTVLSYQRGSDLGLIDQVCNASLDYVLLDDLPDPTDLAAQAQLTDAFFNFFHHAHLSDDSAAEFVYNSQLESRVRDSLLKRASLEEVRTAYINRQDAILNNALAGMIQHANATAVDQLTAVVGGSPAQAADVCTRNPELEVGQALPDADARQSEATASQLLPGLTDPNRLSLRPLYLRTGSYTTDLAELRQTHLPTNRPSSRDLCFSDTYPELALPHSLCWVTVLMTAEHCAYDAFLWAKAQDEAGQAATLSEAVNPSTTATRADDRFTNVRTQLAVLDRERIDAELALRTALESFAQLSETYRLHAARMASVAASQQLTQTIDQLNERQTTWPAELVHATMPNCPN